MSQQEQKEALKRQLQYVEHSIQTLDKIAELNKSNLLREEKLQIARENRMETLMMISKLDLDYSPQSRDVIASILKKALGDSTSIKGSNNAGP